MHLHPKAITPIGTKLKIPRKIHINTPSKEQKETFKKRAQKILDNPPTKERFTAVSANHFSSLILLLEGYGLKKILEQ
jgi:hypothetical protein